MPPRIAEAARMASPVIARAGPGVTGGRGYSRVQCGRRNIRPSRSCSESPISSSALTV